jgi:DNA ligase-1
MKPLLMHGFDWSGQDVAGWWASEKLDGCRAYWDGARFWTRQGKPIDAPAWFTAGLPSTPLDGEIWAGRGGYVAARNAVNHGRWTPEIRFVAFDVPNTEWTVDEAIGYLRAFAWPAHAAAVEFSTVWSSDFADGMALGVKQSGGEGIMLRAPGSKYTTRRTANLLKMK